MNTGAGTELETESGVVECWATCECIPSTILYLVKYNVHGNLLVFN